MRSKNTYGSKKVAPEGSYLEEWLTPEDMIYLRKVVFPVTHRVRARQSGFHRANLRGGTTEFAEHRSYSPGDEVRRIDWRIVGRSDRLEIKLYDDPSILETVFLIDASGSMLFSDSTRSKYHFSQAIVAFLAKTILQQRDPVGLLIAGEKSPGFLYPKSSGKQLTQLLEILYQTPASGKNCIAESIRELGKSLRHPTRVIIVSDFFLDTEMLQHELAFLTSRKHRFHLIQTLAPEEVNFNYKKSIRFASLESRKHLDADPREIAEAYRASLQNHIEQLREICLYNRAGYEPLTTDQPVGLSMTKFIERQSSFKT